MKFSQNGLYIERYLKCTNCGVLIYENDSGAEGAREHDGGLFCSVWCVDWARQRAARRAQVRPAAEAAAQA